ncbi:Pfam:DUF23 [Seminavis robusta]|nr:Pfam:DUF23 [Seminavis robusta]|eukprot:Sro1910_g304910.1 Pfam:DUF23 (431) ;mRNA; r:19414-20706
MLFDPVLEWGIGNNSNQKHWLPTVEQSGRWANIPLCRIPATPESQQQGDKKDIQERDRQDRPNTDISSSDKKKHFLSACVWASATFTTRGSSDPDTSTSLRLIEWLTYQFEIAQFDHVYIYDNSPTDGATTLESVTRLFPSHQVTRIPWKHPVCNNKPPGSNNPGERSSQYAAEASCRIRYGPMTQWLAVLDTDEYLIPQQQKSHDKISLRQWLEQASIEHGDTKIWSFYQTRAIPNIRLMDAVASANHPQFQWKKRDNTTFLETYNCDRLQFPKPGWAWRAQKQIFQPSFVLMHFVHYSIVTRRLLEAPNEWSGLYKDRPPNERRVDERNQAFLLHAKTTSPKATEYWKKQCPVVTVDDTKPDRKGKDKKSNDCPVGIPYPPGAKEGATDAGGREYNCYPHEVVSEVVVPRLKELLPPLLQRYREIIKY